MTAVSDHVLRAGGRPLWFERPTDGHKTYAIPCVTNVFGTPDRWLWAPVRKTSAPCAASARPLANLKEPEPQGAEGRGPDL